MNYKPRFRRLTAKQWRKIGEAYEFNLPIPNSFASDSQIKWRGLCGIAGDAFNYYGGKFTLDADTVNVFHPRHAKNRRYGLMWWPMNRSGSLARATVCYFIAAMIESGDMRRLRIGQ